MPSLFVELASRERIRDAVRAVHGAGYEVVEVYSPYGLVEVDRLLGRRPSRLPFLVFAGGVIGASGAYFLQWYLTAYLYPLDVGGRPPHFPPGYVPITFEMGVLFAALTAFVAVLALGRQLRWWHPVFEVPGFESATVESVWLEIPVSDPDAELDAVERSLRDVEPLRVVVGYREGEHARR